MHKILVWFSYFHQTHKSNKTRRRHRIMKGTVMYAMHTTLNQGIMTKTKRWTINFKMYEDVIPMQNEFNEISYKIRK